ncbi:hypothetical protein ACIHFE_07010 [Streptomyces sp. NPDC052396]|uniref:hypothetical protein n=1 Tax=Streptomyces sp. NPDC052396 TaxID=3365689 RepID=UPI0037CCCD35
METALAVRVFGPDASRLLRRLLTAGVRIGITGLGAVSRGDTGSRCQHGSHHD